MESTPCTAADDGRPCHRIATLRRPVPLCAPHQIEVALAVVPELLRDRMTASLIEPAAPPVRTELVAAARSVPMDGLLGRVHEHVVYFIANGGRVKIGYTTNLQGRLSALSLRPEHVLIALDGGPELERALHAHFAAHRHGETEWFELSPEVFRYIADPDRRARAARGAAVAGIGDAVLEARARQIYTPGMSVTEFRQQLGVGMRRAHPLHLMLRGEEEAE